jgi:LAO/AO transport system kinase
MGEGLVLVGSVQSGDRLALAKLLTLIENESPEGGSALAQLFPSTGRAHIVGITGAPGTGKSSLVNELAKVFRRGVLPAERGGGSRTVGIVAVDPSSPFTGGAFLGDRIRMRDLAGDPGVFVRSMASRGSLGGLARTTGGVIQGLDAAGFEIILVETVGAGQAEVDIARHAHTTVVVEAPGLGDDIQAIKAGVLEIADLLVVNKADLAGAERAVQILETALGLAPRQKPAAQGREAEETWDPPVMRTVASSGEGVEEVARQILRHGGYLRASGIWSVRERERIAAEIESRVRDRLADRWRHSQPDGLFEKTVGRVASREISPAAAVAILLGQGGTEGI